MGRNKKLLIKIIGGTSDRNITFNDICRLLKELGFDERIKGSHHIYTRNEIKEILNIQPKGKMAKPYQVKQFRNLIIKYKLENELDDD